MCAQNIVCVLLYVYTESCMHVSALLFHLTCCMFQHSVATDGVYKAVTDVACEINTLLTRQC